MTDHQQYQHHPLPPPPAPQSHGEQYPGEDYNYEHQAQQHSPVTPHHQAQQPGRSHPPQSPPTSSHQRQPSKQRTFSFQSNKSQSNRSHKSTGSHPRNDAHETHAEKEANRLHSKADPTMAISEAEPSAVQAMTKNSLAPLRSITHRDSLGNTIAEPDRSNPTRSRWERPLDTIRSFEAAIDGGYSRKSFVRSDTDSAANFTRRSSYYAPSTAAPRFPQDSYYGGRPASIARPDSTHMDYNRPNRTSYYDGNQHADGYAHNSNGYGYGGPSRQRTPRMMSEPMNAYGRADREHQQQVYPLPNKDRSYETVTTAAGSGSSAEQAGYQTDPTSSDNSSIHRTSPPKRQGPVNDYGIGFNQPASFQPAAFDMANGARNGGPSHGQYGGPQPAQAQMGPPPVPQKTGGVLLRKQSSAQQQQRPETSDKRKSWFSRRFSKNS